MMRTRLAERGHGLVELLVTAALAALVFGGLMASLQTVIKLMTSAKATTSAMSLANERMEYIRSLAYDTVGTVAGIPNGPIPQHSTTTLNGILFHERVIVQYVDAPEDGIGPSDENGIIADYKEVKVEYSWNDANGTSTVFLLTNIVPPGIESTSGGGTLTVNVFDANVQPVVGAQVRIYNNSGTSTIDTMRYTNIHGIALFAGAPAAANYEITVTKDGYSSERTYAVSAQLANPTAPHVAVVEAGQTTKNFAIDRLGELTVRTVGPSTDGSFVDEFQDLSKSTSTAGVTIESDALVLAGGPESYAPSGTSFSVPVTPSPLTTWHAASWDTTVPEGASLLVHIYDVSDGVYTLVPDSVLPGNAAGFTEGPVVLTNISAYDHPSLALGATLTSSDPGVTPELRDWTLSYAATEPAIPNVPFTIRGTKSIGTDTDLVPVWKYERSDATGPNGERWLGNMEWDGYTVTLGTGTYDIAAVCPVMPFGLDPGEEGTITFTLVPPETHTLRVTVLNAEGNPLHGASVELVRSAFSRTQETGVCGQTFFSGGVTAATGYRIDVQAAGYVSQSVTEVSIDGDSAVTVIMNEA